MAGHNWELVRDIFLARFRGDLIGVVALEQELTAQQALCVHVPNPERPERCYKCGLSPIPVPAQVPAPAAGPGPVKVRRKPLDVRKVG